MWLRASAASVSARRARAGRISRQPLGPPQDPRHARDRDRAGWTPRSPRRRSEEHTSELQSLMRISYAVFCLTKKRKEDAPAENEEDNTDEKDNSRSTKYKC